MRIAEKKQIICYNKVKYVSKSCPQNLNINNKTKGIIC